MTSPEVLSDSDRPICLICNINCVIYAQLMDSLQTFEDYIPSTKNQVYQGTHFYFMVSTLAE